MLRSHAPRTSIPVRAAFALILALMLAGVAALAPVSYARQGASPGDITGVTDPTVRFVHASPDAPAVDVVVDGQPIAQDVAFGSATEYMPLTVGDHQVQIVPTDGGDPIHDQTVTLDGQAAYILAAVGQAAEVQMQVNQVNVAPTPSGQARFRVVHAVPDGPAVDVAVAGSEGPLVDAIGFPGVSDYQDIAAGTYDLEVRSNDGGEVLATASQVQFEAGQAYDLFALGQAGAGNISVLALATRVSVPCGEVLGVGQTSDSCLRIVHAAQDAGPVDVYVGESPIVQGLEYGGATEFIAAPSGQQQLRVVPAGGTLDQAVIDTTQDLGSGQAYQMTAAGIAGAEITTWLSGVDLSPLPENQARVRVVHASPDTEAVDVSVAGADTPFDAIAYGSQSGYVAFDAGSYTFQLRLDAGDTLLLETPDVALEPGMLYDIYAIGQSEDGTLQMVVLATNAGVLQGTAAVMGTSMASPMAGTAGEATAVVAVGSTPVIEAPGAATPAATPTDQAPDQTAGAVTDPATGAVTDPVTDLATAPTTAP